MNTGVGCHFLLQGIFLTKGFDLGLLHCRQTLIPSEPPGKSPLICYKPTASLFILPSHSQFSYSNQSESYKTEVRSCGSSAPNPPRASRFM